MANEQSIHVSLLEFAAAVLLVIIMAKGLIYWKPQWFGKVF